MLRDGNRSTAMDVGVMLLIVFFNADFVDPKATPNDVPDEPELAGNNEPSAALPVPSETTVKACGCSSGGRRLCKVERTLL
jgi:hypothetical protein